jgi:hypothetical protein
MEMSSFLSGPATEPRQRGPLYPPRQAAASLGPDGQALVHPGAVNREGSTEPWANRGRRPAAFKAITLWLRRGLSDAARAWALAAGVPPDLYYTPAPDGPVGRTEADR